MVYSYVTHSHQLESVSHSQVCGCGCPSITAVMSRSCRLHCTWRRPLTWLCAIFALVTFCLTAGEVPGKPSEAHRFAPRAFAHRWTKICNFALTGAAAGLILYMIVYR